MKMENRMGQFAALCNWTVTFTAFEERNYKRNCKSCAKAREAGGMRLHPNLPIIAE